MGSSLSAISFIGRRGQMGADIQGGGNGGSRDMSEATFLEEAGSKGRASSAWQFFQII